MPHPRVPLLLVLAALMLTAPVRAQDSPPPRNPLAPAPPAAIPFSSMTDVERRLFDRLVDSPHWPFQVFALLRLERFEGEDVAEILQRKVTDESWQVRCFALRQSARMGVPVNVDALAKERDGRVIRAALRYGVKLPPERFEGGARKLMRVRALDELLLGLEIVAASDHEKLRREADRRTRRLIANMSEAVAVRISKRLGRIVGVDPPPSTAVQWHAWLASMEGVPILAPPAAASARPDAARPLVAGMEAETFSRLIHYLDGLRQENLDMVIVMDATASMIPMINEARAGVEAFVLFLDDISSTMRAAFVAYRDHDNPPVWEGHPFTTDITSIRDFLFELRITGGADLPEAVFDGLSACGQLDWNEDATRQIVLIGDAQPHDRDVPRLTDLLESYRTTDVIVHTAHVPQEPNADYLRQLPPDGRRQYLADLETHNGRTADAFREIARLGGGESTTLGAAEDLVPAIMHLTIEEAWWPAFDEFYALYLELCR